MFQTWGRYGDACKRYPRIGISSITRIHNKLNTPYSEGMRRRLREAENMRQFIRDYIFWP